MQNHQQLSNSPRIQGGLKGSLGLKAFCVQDNEYEEPAKRNIQNKVFTTLSKAMSFQLLAYVLGKYTSISVEWKKIIYLSCIKVLAAR